MIASIVNKNDIRIYRILEMVPGLLTWIFLTSPIWLGIFQPQAIVYVLTFLTVYWSFLAFRHTYGLFVGYRNYVKDMAINWAEECKKLNFSALPDKATLPSSLEDIRHFVLVPAVSEPESVLRGCIESLLNQTFPSKQTVLVISVEERGADVIIPCVETILQGRKNQFHKVLIYTHPAGIVGEAIGVAGANRTWGAKHAVAELKSLGENLRNYIFSTFDSDHVLNPQFLSRLTHLYLTTDRRDNHYYSTAVHLFNNNLWRVPMLMRIEANAVTLGSLSDWGVTSGSEKDTFAAYSMSLQTLMDADYWDVQLGVDDTIVYWRAYFARNGDFEGKPHYIPYSADAVEGKNFLDSHIALYKQLLRWGWGTIDFPLSVKEFMRNGKIPMVKKLKWMIKHFQKRVILVNMVFLITFGFSLVTMVNPYVKQSNFAYSLPDIMSAILTVTLVCLIPGAYFRIKLSSEMPKNWHFIRKLFTVVFEGPLIMLNLLTYSFFPWVEAQTRMLLGKRMKDLYHTPKRG